MGQPDLDQLAVNTIRFLAVDAVRAGELGAPRPADGRRADGLRALDAASCAQSRRPALARPRPLRPLGRPRLDAALRAAPPDRLRPARSTSSSASASGAAARPAIPSATSRPASRRRPGRSARASPTPSGMAIAEAHLAARYNRPGHDVFDHHTYVLAERRRPDGGRRGGGRLAGRPPAARQADRPLRRQPRHAVGHDVARLHRGRRGALRGLRLARAARRRRQRPRRRSTRALRGARGDDRPAVADLVRTIIGYGAPDKAGHVRGARLAARRRGGAAARRRTSAGRPSRAFFVPARGAGALPRRRVGARRAGRARWNAALRRLRERVSRPGRRARAPVRRRAARAAGTPSLPPFAADAKGIATRKASEAVLQALAAARAGAGRRLGATSNPSTFTWLKQARRLRAAADRPPTASQGARRRRLGLRAGRNIHFGVREHAMGAAVNGLAVPRRLHPLRRDVPRLLRLHAPADPARRRSCELGSDLRLHPRQHRPRRGRPDPPAGRAARRAARDPGPDRSCGRPTPTRRACAWQVAIEHRHRPTALVLTRQNVPTLDRSALRARRGPAPRRLRLNPDVDRSPTSS